MATGVNKFSENLRKAREAMGLSQAELALRMGVTKGAVVNWEFGRNMLPGEDLIRLAHLLDTHVGELLGETESILRKYGYGIASGAGNISRSPDPLKLTGSSPIAALIISDHEMAELLQRRLNAKDASHGTSETGAAPPVETVAPSETEARSPVVRGTAAPGIVPPGRRRRRVAEISVPG